MLAVDTFFSSQAMLAVVVALVALAAFALGWLLLGTAARVKADRDMAARSCQAMEAIRAGDRVFMQNVGSMRGSGQ